MRRTGLEVGVDGTSDTDRGQRGVYVLASNVCSRVFRTGDGVVRTRIQASLLAHHAGRRGLRKSSTPLVPYRAVGGRDCVRILRICHSGQSSVPFSRRARLATGRRSAANTRTGAHSLRY